MHSWWISCGFSRSYCSLNPFPSPWNENVKIKYRKIATGTTHPLISDELLCFLESCLYFLTQISLFCCKIKLSRTETKFKVSGYNKYFHFVSLYQDPLFPPAWYCCMALIPCSWVDQPSSQLKVCILLLILCWFMVLVTWVLTF